MKTKDKNKGVNWKEEKGVNLTWNRTNLRSVTNEIYRNTRDKVLSYDGRGGRTMENKLKGVRGWHKGLTSTLIHSIIWEKKKKRKKICIYLCIRVSMYCERVFIYLSSGKKIRRQLIRLIYACGFAVECSVVAEDKPIQIDKF